MEYDGDQTDDREGSPRQFLARLRQAETDELIATMRFGVAEPLPLAALPLHCRDPKDDKFLACALGAVGYIVTGDDGLLDLDGSQSLAASASLGLCTSLPSSTICLHKSQIDGNRIVRIEAIRP